MSRLTRWMMKCRGESAAEAGSRRKNARMIRKDRIDAEMMTTVVDSAMRQGFVRRCNYFFRVKSERQCPWVPKAIRGHSRQE